MLHLENFFEKSFALLLTTPIRVKKKKRPLTNEEISDTIMDAQPGR